MGIVFLAISVVAGFLSIPARVRNGARGAVLGVIYVPGTHLMDGGDLESMSVGLRVAGGSGFCYSL
jgi:hypothetical protein